MNYGAKFQREKKGLLKLLSNKMPLWRWTCYWYMCSRALPVGVYLCASGFAL